MTYKVRHTTKYTYSAPVPVSRSQVRLAPRNTINQHCGRHRLIIRPTPSSRGRRIDYYGNQVDYFSLNEPHESLTVTAHSEVELLPATTSDPGNTPPWESIATSLTADLSKRGLNAYQFVFDSPQIKASDALADFARRSFPPGRPILDAARELTTRIHEEFTYDQNATTVHTSLEEAFEHRHGVCQDFAHIEIGCLRSLGLAASYVSGYLQTEPPAGQPRLVGADASHAWLSVYCGEPGWFPLDPTTNIPVDTRHVTVAWGRDYQDVCPIQGVFVGGGKHAMTVAVDVRPER